MNAPYKLAALLLGGLSIVCSPLPAQLHPASPPSGERVLFDSANRERAARRLPPLQWDQNLASAARDHVVLMARSRSISHQFAGELGLSDRLLRAGVHFSLAAENVGNASDAAELHSAWMNSSGHRANLLDPDANAVGIAVVQRGSQIYGVEDFARITVPLSFEEQERRVGALLAARGLRLVETSQAVRQTCALSRGVAPGLHPKFLFRYLAADLANLPSELLDELASHSGQYRSAAVGACAPVESDGLEGFRLAILLY